MTRSLQLPPWLRRAARSVGTLLLTAAAGGFLAATMARFSPGFEADERQLDPRLNPAGRQALERERAGERHVALFYARYMAGLCRGDLGYSRTLSRPVSALIAERAAVTLRLVGVGLAAGWVLGLALALAVVALRIPLAEAAANALAGGLLSVPSAVIGILLFVYGGAPAAGMALVVFPRVFSYARDLVAHAYAMPHVLAARARGVRESRIAWRHVLPVAAPELLALAGVSLSIGFGAAIPLEAVCDLPGIGQLAWKAALGHDLSVLVALTLLIALVTQAANAASGLAAAAWRPQ